MTIQKISLATSLSVLAAAASLVVLAAAPAIGQAIPQHLQPVPPSPLTVPRIILPPAKYDKPYTGTLYVVRMDDLSILHRVCGTSKYIACAINSDTSCIIFLGPLAQNDDRVMRHELGHCNGWPGDHPGMRQ